MKAETKYPIGKDGISRDKYGRPMEFDLSVLRTKKGKRKKVGPKTYAVRKSNA
jgi:hypothetical protein